MEEDQIMTPVHVVLHRSIYPRNVGMCARAIGNMGAGRLILVAPQCALTNEAKQGAAHAQDILANASIYNSLADFHTSEGEGLRIALSGRDNRLKAPDELSQALKDMLEDSENPIHHSSRPIYLMFGPEDDGLSTEEMELCHHVCRLPVFGPIPSLNLSHAVLLTLYMVQTSLGHKMSLTPDASTHEMAPLFYPAKTIHIWLEALGFDLSARRVNIEKTLNRIFLSRSPTQEELRILDSVLHQTVRKLKERLKN